MKRWLLALAALLMAVAACQAPPTPEEPVTDTESAANAGDVEAAMTVVFEADACSYDGPTTIPPGRVTVNWRIEGQPRDAYALAIVTLDEGKTFEDLDAWRSIGQPLWTHLRALEERDPDDLSPFTALVTEGPIFVVCFIAHPEAKVGVLGPVEVEG